jgi:hypothetical protein
MLHRLARREREAIPQHAAVGLADDQRALPDREAWIEAYAGKAKVVTPDNLATLGQGLAREPLLAPSRSHFSGNWAPNVRGTIGAWTHTDRKDSAQDTDPKMP